MTKETSGEAINEIFNGEIQLNIGDVFYEQFMSGKFNAKEFLTFQLEANNTKLSKYISKAISDKKVKINISILKRDGKHVIASDGTHEWWLAVDSEVVRGDYAIHLPCKKLFIVGIKK